MTSTNNAAALNRARVLGLEDARWDALRSGDVKALTSLFADELTYIHSNGVEDSKAGYLDTLGSGALGYRAIGYSTTAMRLHGPTAVVTGTADMTVTTAAGEFSVAIAYTAVWCSLKAGAGLSATPQLIAWHSSPRNN